MLRRNVFIVTASTDLFLEGWKNSFAAICCIVVHIGDINWETTKLPGRTLPREWKGILDREVINRTRFFVFNLPSCPQCQYVVG